ncbi:probable E3 ubiquitin-protein ligase BAH1-like 1 [Typha latifolia]|uniref:probable E3 ubiquitin-protein ligase BAH1-like 1 n=1 Tax=Typha latifolia TaxID=4733 RepID=UPI003C2ACA0A
MEELKFVKRYEECMKGWEKKRLPELGLTKLWDILESCHCGKKCVGESSDGCGSDLSDSICRCPDQCSVCDGTFFPLLLKEMSAVVDSFNKRAQKFHKMNLASGYRKFVRWLGGKFTRNHENLMKEGRDLVIYAIINSIAVRKILEKYDKIHHSKKGQDFKSKAQSMDIEILQSPWIYELIAFHINLKESKTRKTSMHGLSCDCSLTIENEKPILSCGICLFDSLKLEIELSCPICLDSVFDAVALTCGHVFCYTCSCSAASVTIIDGLKSAHPKARCPICRKEGVYKGAAHLDELNILLRRRCPDYWEQRRRAERKERMKQIKEHWESQCQAMTGI